MQKIKWPFDFFFKKIDAENIVAVAQLLPFHLYKKIKNQKSNRRGEGLVHGWRDAEIDFFSHLTFKPKN